MHPPRRVSISSWRDCGTYAVDSFSPCVSNKIADVLGVVLQAGRFLAVGGAASVALLELTHVPSVGDLSRAGDGQEGVKETGQEETQEEQRSRATRQAKSRAPQLTGAAGHRLTLQPVATFTLGDRNNSVSFLAFQFIPC